MSSFSKICHWLNLSADSTPPPMPARRQLNVAAENHQPSSLPHFTFTLSHLRGARSLVVWPHIPGESTHAFFKMTISHFSPLASDHQHFSFPFQLFHLTEKIQAIWGDFTQSPHQTCPAARCAAAVEEAPGAAVHWPPSPRSNSRAAASLMDGPLCAGLSCKYLVCQLSPSLQQPCGVGIRFTAGQLRHQHSVTFQNDTGSVRGAEFTCVTALSPMPHPSGHSCLFCLLHHQPPLYQIFPSTYIHILRALILSTDPWLQLSLQRPLRIPLLLKFLVRVIFAVSTNFFLISFSNPVLLLSLRLHGNNFVKVTNDLHNVKGRGSVKARWTFSVSYSASQLFYSFGFPDTTLSWFSSRTAVTSLSPLLDRPLLANS